MVEVVDCTRVDIIAPAEPFKRGGRARIKTSFHTLTGHRTDLHAEAGVDEQDMGTFGRTGFFTTGPTEGTATSRIKYGPAATDVERELITIGPDVTERADRGGSDIPLILLCGDPVPGMDDMSLEQQTHSGGPEHATIIEEPQWPVVWINHESRESALKKASSSSGSERAAPPGESSPSSASSLR